MSTSAVAKRGRLPNLLVIGAKKCATTSLHYYLSLHPQVFMSRQKELDFFSHASVWAKGVDWYKAQFPSTAEICGESSPSYTNYPFWGGVPERIAALVPDAKLIYLIRDPLERVISDYVHEVVDGREQRTFAEAMRDLANNRYLSRSLYFMQLEQYLQYFSEQQILVLTQEELYGERQKTLETVFRFLAVAASFSTKKFQRLEHRSSDKRQKTALGLQVARLPLTRLLRHLSPHNQWYCERLLYLPFSRKVDKPQAGPELRRRLLDYLRDDGKRMQEYAGRTFAGWCV
jgi:sulfotransferase family protein